METTHFIFLFCEISIAKHTFRALTSLPVSISLVPSEAKCMAVPLPSPELEPTCT